MTGSQKSAPDGSLVRTRVAPSPTGFPHIGTLYQALFDYALAHKNGGQFIVRIEDTDQARSIEGAEDAIYEALDWIGLVEDESPRMGGPNGPYKQSERLELYQQHARELIENGHAYYCFCSKERLEEVRNQQQAAKQVPMYDKHCRNLPLEEVKTRLDSGAEHVIRMKIPEEIDGKTILTLVDSIRGAIEFDLSLIDDQVILKSDGFPTYHLAVVVDDHLMKITHPIRGEEWISSWPKHALLYRAFGWAELDYNHTPILRNPDKSKMSKRHGHTAVSWYQEKGILPEALRNFLALMGWSHPDGAEIFSLDEFVERFDFADVNPGGPTFDLTKLEWLNGEYIRMMSEEDLADRIYEYTQRYAENRYARDLIGYTVPLVQTRLKTLQEYDSYCRFFVGAPSEYEMDLAGNEELFQTIVDGLEKIDESDWHAEIIGEHLQAIAQGHGIPFGKFFMLMRVALTGKKVTPPLNESMELLGKQECLRRLLCLNANQ
jgi:glutamyl-tRNA synthetase